MFLDLRTSLLQPSFTLSRLLQSLPVTTETSELEYEKEQKKGRTFPATTQLLSGAAVLGVLCSL
jgi:hypothetical protein